MDTPHKTPEMCAAATMLVQQADSTGQKGVKHTVDGVSRRVFSTSLMPTHENLHTVAIKNARREDVQDRLSDMGLDSLDLVEAASMTQDCNTCTSPQKECSVGNMVLMIFPEEARERSI